ncbi:spermine oxidase isoform X1 [Drosophila grimshawi]|uniref:spermine oxidase isoform X1 n=1 Tax=Drosophila grimshawi TaxID=7222 RepID=UPI000C8707FB|nr:spermine oxidase isoform X1 [Drosophila grimshawi]
MGNCCSRKRNSYHASDGIRTDPKRLGQFLENQPNLLILGAGAAGLACAVELKNNGFQNVRLVEMSDRIGGRIRTMKFADNYVDLGAQWVHGQQNNVVYEMVGKHNLLESTDGMFLHVDWIRSNGERISRPLAKKLVNILSEIFTKRREELVNREGTYGEYLMEKFNEELSKPCFRHIDHELAAEFLRTFKKMEGGTVDTDMSAAGYGTYSPCPGDCYLNWRDKGFRQFLRVLCNGDEMNLLGELKDCIDLNTRVLRIEWDRLDGSVLVSCENDKSYLADHVIVTVSLGVLKKNAKFFHPNLPQTKRKAINFLGFAHICKIFVEFEEPFWHDNWLGFNAVWRSEDINQTQLEWVPDIYGFYVYAYQPRVLMGWAAGSYTEQIESIDSKVLAQGVMYMLKLFLPQVQIPQPKRVLSTKWSSDPAHLGAYSYPTLLTQNYNTGPEQLAQPVYMFAFERNKATLPWNHMPILVRPIILFAGEATSSNYYSTVHGAVESGIREARRLTGFYQN